MFDRYAKPELPGDPYRGQYVICPVRVSLERDLSVEHLQERLHFHVIIGLVVILFVLLIVFLHPFVLGRLHQALPEQCGCGHPCHGRLSLFVVYGFGILAQCDLHCDRLFYDHVLDSPPVCLKRRKLSADHICTARPCDNGGDAVFSCLNKGPVCVVDSVDRPQVRHDRIRSFIAVISFEPDRVLPHANVAVRVHKSRQNITSLRIYDLRRCRLQPRQFSGIIAQRRYFPTFCRNISVAVFSTYHCKYL